MADEMKPTPRGFISGLFSDVLGRTLNMPSLPRTGIPSLDLLYANRNPLFNLMGVGDVQKTAERISYGEPLTTGSGMTTKPREETLFAGMAVAPLAPVAGRLASQTGRTVGRLAGQEINAAMTGQPTRSLLGQITPKPLRMTDTSYRGQHTAPGSDFGAPLHDLSQIYPDDIYSSKAAQYYGGSVPYDQKAVSIAQQYRNKPDALVTIYRAVPKEKSNSEKLAEIEKQMAAYMRRGTLPKDAKNYSSGSQWYDYAYEMREKLRQMPDEMSQGINDINAGDWVTLTREYAKDHGESALRGQYKILSKKVKAKELWTNADSIHEFGYQPEATASPQPFSYPQQAALDLAQQRAALPVEQGGLGLPANNTPMDRARAMGFGTEGYRGSTVSETIHQNPLWWSEDPQYASAYAAHTIRPPKGQPDPYAGNVMPVLVNIGKSKEFEKFNIGGVPTDPFSGFNEGVETGFRRYSKNEVNGDMGGKIWEALTLPQNVRSRFAAFDPFRKDVATATAMGVALPDLLAQPVDQYQQTYETTPMYTDPFGNTIGSSIR